jgi:hypothetical protein
VSTAAELKNEPRIRSVEVSDRMITATLVDGRTVSVPLSWSWRLQQATPAQRAKFVIAPSGLGVHWPDVDEDISARGMLNGTPAPRPPKSK